MVRQRVLALFVGFLTYAPGFAADAIDAEAMIEKVMPAIVAIRADTPEGIAAGTGFLVDSTGVVVTNLHVIEGATRVTIKLHSGEQYTQIRVASFDQDRDLAILRLPGFDLPTVSLGNSDAVKVGATVYAIGNPLGLEESVTKGIVSSIRVAKSGTKIIQTDSAVSPGNSGGPLINESGDVVGVVTFKISSGENLNFAVPINYARALLSFEQPISLDELAQELATTEVSLFSNNESDALTGNWKSLTNLTLLLSAREEGEYLYVTGKSDDSIRSFDLKKQADGTYKGLSRGQIKLWYTEGGQKIYVDCYVEDEVEIPSASTSRIEGRTMFAPFPKSGRAQVEYVKTCGESEAKNKKWQDFVWVRAD